jgi:hypothetical protein
MSANLGTGRVRLVRYCGSDYIVRPGPAHGQKQAWVVFCGDEQITRFTPTRSKAVKAIHEHAVAAGAYPARQADGLTYSQLVAALCR